MTKDPAHRKEGRVARQLRLAREIRREPRVVVPRARAALARLWAAKGGGFYGLGYVVAFISFEIKTFGASVVSSGGVSEFAAGFVTNQLLQYVLRVSFESILNAFLALLWPFHVLPWLGGWGILALVGGYLGFEYLVRPSIESWFPELRAARDEKARLAKRPNR